MSRSLGLRWYTTLINHDLGVAAGGLGLVAIPEPGILYRISTAIGSTAPVPTSDVDVFVRRTVSGAVVDFPLTIGNLYTQGTASAVPIVWIPLEPFSLLEGDTVYLSNGTAQTTPVGAQNRVHTIEVAQSEGLAT